MRVLGKVRSCIVPGQKRCVYLTRYEDMMTHNNHGDGDTNTGQHPSLNYYLPNLLLISLGWKYPTAVICPYALEKYVGFN